MISKYFTQKGGVEIVGIAYNSLEAMELLKFKTPDIIVLDIVMPNSDGFILLKYLDAHDCYQNLDVIVLSSLNNDVVIQETVKLGASYYMTKPFKLDLLYNRILETYNKNKILKQFIYSQQMDS